MSGYSKLAESRGSTRGVYGGRERFFLGPTALIEYHQAVYRPRPRDGVSVLLAAAYKQVPDLARCSAKLSEVLAARARP